MVAKKFDRMRNFDRISLWSTVNKWPTVIRDNSLVIRNEPMLNEYKQRQFRQIIFNVPPRQYQLSEIDKEYWVHVDGYSIGVSNSNYLL